MNTHETANQLIAVGKSDQLYVRMQSAISACFSVDDCAEIASQAHAIAAYFKQIEDDASVRKFFTVKLRAWRKIGEFLITVDSSDCETMAARIRKVRASFDRDPSVKKMSDSAIGNALKLGELRDDFFEQEVGYHSSVSTMLAAYQRLVFQEWRASPEGQAVAKKTEAELARRTVEQEEANTRERAKAHEAYQKAQQEKADLAALNAAREEVGYTMDRRDRERMREVMLLLKDPVHKVLRQAAFDRHMTMQAVLRSGLAMWFIANGYAVDLDDLQPKQQLDKAS